MKNNRNKQKKLITAVATAFIITASATPLLSDKVEAAAVANFKDVPAGAFYEKAVQTLSEKGVIGGYGDGIFKPGKSVTRAEAAKMLAFDLGLTTAELNSNFKDVKNGDWYYQPVTALSQAGGISGYENGTFQPNKTITRAEMASMLVKAYSLQANGSAEKVPFNDVASSSWYASAVQMLYGNKITSGKSANKFAPNDPVTRGEIAAFIHKVNEAKINEINDAKTIEEISEDKIKLSGKTYQISANLTGILNKTNASILENAKINFSEKDGTISQITYLQINKDGKASENGKEFSNNIVLDGKGNTINGTLEVNANYISIRNITINKNLVITPQLANDFYSENVTINGQTFVNGGDSNTVVFNNANLKLVEINKKSVRLEPKGKTNIQELTINTDAHIKADENAVIGKTTINSDANTIKLEGPFETVGINGSKSITINGNALIKELLLNQNANLILEIKNKITKVTVEKGGKLSIGANTTIGIMQLPSGLNPADVVSNYESRKNNIGETKNTVVSGGGGPSAPATSAPTVDSILNKFKPSLENLKTEAQTDFNTLKNKVKDSDLYKQSGEIDTDLKKEALRLYFDYSNQFNDIYKEVKDELTKNGFSAEKALPIEDEFNSIVTPYLNKYNDQSK